MMLSAKKIWALNDTQLQGLLDSGKLRSVNNSIQFYSPSFAYYHNKYFQPFANEFATISVTGNKCTLNCKHCGGKILESMYPATTPEELWKLCLKLKSTGTKGVLISGGCLPSGSVPLDKFTNIFYKLRNDLELTLYVHTGITTPKTAEALKKANVDAVLIDVIGSNYTINKTLNLNISINKYIQTLQILRDVDLRVVPHVIVGLNDGKLDGELAALQIIAQTIQPSAVVIIAFMPIKGSKMQKTRPSNPLDIAKTILAARVMFPKTPLLLGCMRPKGQNRIETDVYAIKAGVDGIAFPAEKAIEYAQTIGLKTVFSSYCCARIFEFT